MHVFVVYVVVIMCVHVLWHLCLAYSSITVVIIPQRLVLAHRLRDYRGQSRALCNIGNCLRAQGQLEEACTYYLKVTIFY